MYGCVFDVSVSDEQRATVERALERDHRRTLRVRARELDRVLDRFRAGVEERRLRGAGERRDREQPLGERDVHLVRDDREVGVEEARGLLLHGLDDVRMRVADVQAADAAGEVEERVAVDVGQRRAPRALGDDDRQVHRERIGDDALLPLEDRLRDFGPGTSVWRRIARVVAIAATVAGAKAAAAGSYAAAAAAAPLVERLGRVEPGRRSRA